MIRTLTDIDDDIARCRQIQASLRDLGDVADQDRVIARLNAERDAAVRSWP